MCADNMKQQTCILNFWIRKIHNGDVLMKLKLLINRVVPCLAVIMAFALVSVVAQETVEQAAASTNASAPGLYVDGELYRADEQPIVRNGILYIPLTYNLMDLLDAELETQVAGGKMRATVITAQAQLEYTEGETLYIARDQQRELVEPAIVFSGNMTVPFESFFEDLDCTVVYGDNRIDVTTPTGLTQMEKLPGGKTKIEAQEEIISEEVEEVLKTVIGYTYENKLTYENVKVSGDESQSSMEPKSDFYNDFSIRFLGQIRNGYELQSSLRTRSTTDDDQKHGEVKTFFITMSKNKVKYSVYDLFPKITRYTFKNYRLQGVQYERTNNLFKYTIMMGKTPKKLRTSRYNRYVQGYRLENDVAGDAMLGLGYVDVKDTGVLQGTNRLDNQVLSLNGKWKKTALSLDAETALSKTKYNYGQNINAKAKWAEFQCRVPDMKLKTSYERTGSEFVSETSFFTPGRREFSALLNRKIGRRVVVGGGYKSIVMRGEDRLVFPLQLNMIPLKQRSSFRLTAARNYDKTRGTSGTRFTDRRKLNLKDRIGTAKVRVDFDRKAQKNTAGVQDYRTMQRYRVDTPLTKKLSVNLQFRKERRTGAANPLNRFYKSKFSYEIGDWTEASVGLERYYNGTSNNRTALTTSYKQIDIYNDREMSIEYKFFNYRDYNNNQIRLMYSFLK